MIIRFFSLRVKERDCFYMAKRQHGNFIQTPRIFWNRYRDGKVVYKSPYIGLSVYAKWLFVTLKEYEHAFTGRSDKIRDYIYMDEKTDGKDWFFIDNATLAEQAGMSKTTMKKAKKELEDYGLIETYKVYFIDSNGRKSTHWTTGYLINE